MVTSQTSHRRSGLTFSRKHHLFPRSAFLRRWHPSMSPEEGGRPIGGVAPEGEDAGEGRSARQHLLHRRMSDPTHVHDGGGCSRTTGCILNQPKRIFHAVLQQIREKRESNDGSFLSGSVSTVSKHKSDNQNCAPNEINSELQISDNVVCVSADGGLITQNSRGRGMILTYQPAERWREDRGGCELCLQLPSGGTQKQKRRAQSDRRWVGESSERTSDLMSLSSPGFAGLWKER